MSTGIKLSILQALINKSEPEAPDWRLLCDALRLDPTSHAAGSRIIGILRALSRSLAAGLWDEKRPQVFVALSGSNIRDKLLPRHARFTQAMQLGTFSAAPIECDDLPPSWRAAAWPEPWMIAHPVNNRQALLFVIYATRPSSDVIGNLQILLSAIAEWIRHRAVLDQPA
jgi:hypothetical protein